MKLLRDQLRTICYRNFFLINFKFFYYLNYMYMSSDEDMYINIESTYSSPNPNYSSRVPMS